MTGSSITIGIVNLDTNDLAPVCPRCGDGDGANGAAGNAMVEAWKRDGRDTIYGRKINIVNISYPILNQEQARTDCEQMVQQVHPFLVIGDSMSGSMGQCLTVENHMLTMDGLLLGDQGFLHVAFPNAWQMIPTPNTDWANYALFLDHSGLLKGQTLCMYSPDDSSGQNMMPTEQEDLNNSFRAELHKLGYHLKVDITYGSANSDGVAVTQFRTNGCTVAFILGILTEPSGFQNLALQQGYNPKYPIAEVNNDMTDATSDVTYNANAEDGNIGMKTEFWDWTSRKPPVAENNAAAQYCINAYQAYEHRTLDVYNNDIELHYLLEICSAMDVVRQAIVNAGPSLTASSYVAALERIHGMQTGYVPTVSFGPTKLAGGDTFAMAKFNKNRWPPDDNYWAVTGPWQPFYLGAFGS